METRANYVLVGGFVLAGFLAIIIFLVWLSKTNLGEPYQIYDIYFRGSVTGLKNGATVQYRGVPIGVVKDISIKPDNLEIIRVRVAVDQKVSLREDVTASLETQGLTGIAFIQIKGGTNDSPVLRAKPDQKYPVIPAKTSLFEEVAGSVPEILGHMTQLIRQMQDFLSEENRDSFRKTIQNVEDITNYLSPKGKKENVLSDIKKSANSIEATMKEFREMVKENRREIKDFSTHGLDSFAKFLNEGREAMSTIKRIGDSLERSPSRFLYNDTKQGVRAQ
ncbi:MlaD family protein [Candidatus Paracaedibacter symbiosus]|uniref:MlaD family protein n=1 Tax=Candidatus Paracaedibacter symbiosus TaxID=244582 RepID=UPI00069014B2|nr:MlaD family protein [Candidatus Paracaedibacter symbiosus]